LWESIVLAHNNLSKQTSNPVFIAVGHVNIGCTPRLSRLFFSYLLRFRGQLRVSVTVLFTACENKLTMVDLSYYTFQESWGVATYHVVTAPKVVEITRGYCSRVKARAFLQKAHSYVVALLFANARVPNLSVTTYSFSIPTDAQVPLKFLTTERLSKITEIH